MQSQFWWYVFVCERMKEKSRVRVKNFSEQMETETGLNEARLWWFYEQNETQWEKKNTNNIG